MVSSLSALMFTACAVPERNGDQDSAISAPRDCEPVTGSRVPASCTRPRGEKSAVNASNVQTIERPARLETR
ncbi:MAG: hypothetical protein U1F53_07855 [Burkholderiaceae bacterium]